MLSRRLLHVCRTCYQSVRFCVTQPQVTRLLSLGCRALLTNVCSRRLTDGRALRRLLEKFGQAHGQRLRKGGRFLMGSCLFAFEYRVSDEEVDECLRDSAAVRDEVVEAKDTPQAARRGQDSAWSLVVQRDSFFVWRKAVGAMFEYRIYGSYDDISPKAFFDVQEDLEYRSEWDEMVLDLHYLSRDRETNTDLIRWVAQFPRPMRPREYIYKRRWHIDPSTGTIVLINRSVASEFGDADASPDTVRVREYKSDMVIWPHAGIDDNGFDYVLTYFDNPQSSIPSFAYNWVASSGLPDFMSKLHQATKHRRSRTSPPTDTVNMRPLYS